MPKEQKGCKDPLRKSKARLKDCKSTKKNVCMARIIRKSLTVCLTDG